MTISNSPDITVLQVQATFDISGTNPVVSLVNFSQGSGLANITWWFVLTSPSGTPIHSGSLANPDITGNWTDFDITDAWPRPFNAIEWSGAPYSLVVYIQDRTGAQYNAIQMASICRPAGNTPLSKNSYGLANTYIQVQCQDARVFFQDQTNSSYKGLPGTQISSVLRVIYPIDDTATIPPPFVIGSFSTALVPISYSSDNYQFLAQSVYDYDFGGYVHVRIRYQQLATFAVWCNIDLCPLACEIVSLINQVEAGNCGDVHEANRKLGLINSKFALVVMGKLEPLCGIDVPTLIDEIQAIGGFTCDCCNTPTGIIPQTNSIVDGFTFSIVHVGGDVGGTVTTTGTNIQFNLHDVSYIFKICNNSPVETTAFTVLPSVSGDGYTKTYCLSVDVAQFAIDLANVIQGNGAILNQWQALFSGGQSFNLIVDGGCIFQSTSTCNYDFTLLNIPINTTYALLSGIKIGSTNNSLSYSFNLTNLAGLQTYLNALGFGTFSVTHPSGQTVLIHSSANPNEIISLTYKISGTSFIADLSRNCTGYVAIPANEVIQNIINYICGITDDQVVTSQDYTLCYIDSTGTQQTTIITAGNTLASLFEAIASTGCQTVAHVQSLSAVTCANLKSIFGVNSLSITATDFLFGTKGGGACSQVAYLDAFNYMLTASQSNSTSLGLFCDLVALCGQGLTCAPYNFFNVVITTYNTACTEIVGIEFTLS